MATTDVLIPLPVTVPPEPLALRLGIPGVRLRAGFAPISVADWVRADGRYGGRLGELFDGVWVEKPMGFREAHLEGELFGFLRDFVRQHRLGLVTPASAAIDFGAGKIYLPDAAFFPWTRCPGRRLPAEKVCPLIPTLVAEVLSDSNTAAEMAHKRNVYFAAEVKLVWEIDLQLRTVAVYTRSDVPDVTLTRTQSLEGGTELPGFTLPLAELFAVLDEHG